MFAFSRVWQQSEALILSSIAIPSGITDGKMHLFCKVRVIYGEPMPAAQFAMEGRRDTKKLRANKQALLDAWEKMGR